MTKPTFWQRLFGGVEATIDTVVPVADAQGNTTFSTEQFEQLTAHLESLDAKEVAYTALESKLTAATEAATKLEGIVSAHTARLEKIAQVPAIPVAATAVEPVVATGDAVVIDPVDAELKAMQK
jgi:hypothetical protein